MVVGGVFWATPTPKEPTFNKILGNVCAYESLRSAGVD